MVPETPDSGPHQIVFLKGFQNNGFGDSELDLHAEALTLSSAPAALMASEKVETLHSTYHAHTHQYRPSPWSPMSRTDGVSQGSLDDSSKYLNIPNKPLPAIATNGVAHFHHDRRNKSATSTPSRSALTTPTHRKYSPANSNDSEVRTFSQFYEVLVVLSLVLKKNPQFCDTSFLSGCMYILASIYPPSTPFISICLILKHLLIYFNFGIRDFYFFCSFNLFIYLFFVIPFLISYRMSNFSPHHRQVALSPSYNMA